MKQVDSLMPTRKKEAPCHNCKNKDVCDILKIYQVVVYDCKCLEFQEVNSYD